jgi:hypothetical protein
VLALLHGQVFAFIPAIGFLLFAALLLIYALKGQPEESGNSGRSCALLAGVATGFIGLALLALFLDEFRYFIKYNF